MRFKGRSDEANLANINSFNKYQAMLDSISVSMFEWQGLPLSIDISRAELELHKSGSVAFFRDDVTGDYLMLPYSYDSSNIDVYNNPTAIQAYANNGYRISLKKGEFVIIYNNSMRIATAPIVTDYALRLSKIERCIDVNIFGQRTTTMILCDEKQRLTMQQLMQQYDSNTPFIFGSNALNLDSVRAIPLQTTFVADKMQELKDKIFNECMGYLGIPNVAYQKKERLITDEVKRGMGGTMAEQYTRLVPRQYAAELINRTFGLDISVNYRSFVDNEGGEEDGAVYDKAKDNM